MFSLTNTSFYLHATICCIHALYYLLCTLPMYHIIEGMLREFCQLNGMGAIFWDSFSLRSLYSGVQKAVDQHVS